MDEDVSGGQIVPDKQPDTSNESYTIAVIVLYVIFNHKINEYYDLWQQRRDERLNAATDKKNEDRERNRLDALKASRDRLQEELDRQAAECKEKLSEKEKQRRIAAQKLLEKGGVMLGNSSNRKYKDDYHPLMGDGGSSYRPAKKSCCKKGGGCG